MPEPSSPLADAQFMAHALDAAARARGRTSPNPMVGAVVVAAGRPVGTGFHAQAGTPHAEPLALAEAGARARGATLYVTLEPCHHTGRTGPCTDAIVRAGIARVVVGAPDNDERVQGRGFRFLRQAGIEVTTGVGAAACTRLNTAYHFAKGRKRAFVSALGLPESDAEPPAYTQWLHQLAQTIDVIVQPVDAADAAAAESPLARARAADGHQAALLLWDPHNRLEPFDLRCGPHRRLIVAGPPLSLAKKRAWAQTPHARWQIPRACKRPLAWLSRACFAAGLYHVCLTGEARWASQARQEGVLCRSWWLGRSARSPEGGPRADWSRAVSPSWAVFGAWAPCMRPWRQWQPLP